jgi:peptidyl-prolyl cis-trans isomerase D
MFEFIRNHKRLMQFLLLIIIGPSFVLVGIESYQNRGGGATSVAEVGDQKITQQDWEQAQRRQIDQARQMMGAQFDQKMFDTPEAKQAVLENLVAERAINAEVTRNHLTVSDATLQKTILGMGAFKKADGSFDMDAYKAALAAQGMTPAMFDERMRRDLAVQQLSGSIQASAFVPRSVSARLSDLNEQEREVQELLFPAANFVSQVKVTDDMVKAFYDKNAQLFTVPESVKAEYVVFDAGVVESQVNVSDADVTDFYNKNKNRFSTPEQRTASHILITTKPGASAAETAAAKAKAEAVLAEVRKAPDQFAAIAKAQSQDPGSAPAGGDLGVIEKDALPKPVEDAIFGLKQGETSGLVKSDYGFHIITVPSIKPATLKTLDEARAEVTAELKKQAMSKKYSELAEVFTNTVYEQADSLKPVADKLKLKIETVEGLTRNPNPALGKAPFNNAKFLQAIFSQDALKEKRNTEAVEVAPSVLVAGHVVEFKPAAKRPLAEVDAAIRQRVAQEEAVRLARQAGEARLSASAKAPADASGFGEAKVVSRTKEPTINQVAAIAVLKANVDKLPAFVGVEVPGQGFGVYRINKVSMPAQPDQARRKQEAEQISRAIGEQEMYGYIEALKKKAKAKITAKPADLGNQAQ